MDPKPRVFDLLLELIIGLFGLAHARRHVSALIEGNVETPQYPCLFLRLDGRTEIEALLVLGFKLHVGKHLAHDLFDGVKRCLLVIDGGKDNRVLAITQRHRFIQGRRQEMPD